MARGVCSAVGTCSSAATDLQIRGVTSTRQQTAHAPIIHACTAHVGHRGVHMTAVITTIGPSKQISWPFRGEDAGVHVYARVPPSDTRYLPPASREESLPPLSMGSMYGF